MAHQQLILCDTNIIIEFYKNNETVISELQNIGQENIAISVITVAELIYGAFNKKELGQILKDTSNLQVLHINQEIGELHLELMTTFSLSHNLTLPDALIGATALVNEIPLYTLNKKDFKYIPRINLY
ncbi:MAG: type II toxin-antitoxin system VapC family toxin [Bacteroidota bacterium]